MTGSPHDLELASFCAQVGAEFVQTGGFEHALLPDGRSVVHQDDGWDCWATPTRPAEFGLTRVEALEWARRHDT